MEVVRWSDAAAFLASAEPWLLQAEIENNVIVSLARSIADGSRVLQQTPYFAAAYQGDRVVCCALRTPPYRLVVSAGPADALAALAQDAFAAFGSLPGVNGPTAAAGAFAAAWTALTADRARISTRLRIHATERVAPDLPPASGVLRRATPADRDLAVRWFTDFAREALPDQPSEAEAAADRHLRCNTLFFWCDDAPVALCGHAGRTANGARVGPVFTPKPFRGRGYGTAAVAELTRRLLAEGGYCSLYTDLANPTSNSIYRRIGYRPLCDVDEYAFVRDGE